MKTCLFCQGLIESSPTFSKLLKIDEDVLCETCEGQLERATMGCPNCFRKGLHDVCDDCLYWQAQMLNIPNESLYYYNTFAKEIIRRVKFTGECQLLQAFNKEIRRYFKTHFHKPLYLIPVPLHHERLLERGFNQSGMICRMLPYPTLDILEKITNEKQSKKTKAERLVVHDNFKLKEDIDLGDKTLIIIDDIYTTGATIHQIGKLLYDHGAKNIRSFTIFRS